MWKDVWRNTYIDHKEDPLGRYAGGFDKNCNKDRYSQEEVMKTRENQTPHMFRAYR